jgi:zinc transport system substrate-binding protein
MRSRLSGLGVLIALLLWPVLAAAAEGPKVVVSLKPIHALAAGVMAGVGEPALIVKGAASEHFYALRPSDAALLEAADVVFWIGPTMESYLVRPLASLARRAEIVTLIDRPELTRLPRREGGLFDKEPESQEASAIFDGHLWLDPENARRIVKIMAETLARRDPAHAPLYAANAARLEADLAALDAELGRRLAPLRGKPFIVFHDAYQYLEARYGLTVVGSITVDPSLPPSVQRVAAIQSRIRQAGVSCVFSEPQFEPKLVRVLIEGTKARSAVLDPLGAALPPGRAAYFTLLRDLAASLHACLDG